jgi:hypothetical protein
MIASPTDKRDNGRCLIDIVDVSRVETYSLDPYVIDNTFFPLSKIFVRTSSISRPSSLFGFLFFFSLVSIS